MKTGPRRGFSLIEMAIILVIIGAIVSVVLPKIIGGVKKDTAQKSKAGVRVARDEIIGYAMNPNHRLPPDTNPLDFCQLTTVSQTRDIWGNTLYYKVAAELNGENICGAPQPAMEIHEDGSLLRSNVAFVVFSFGENHNPDANYAPGSPEIVNIFSFGADDGSGNKFDDIVEYVTWSQLKAKVCPQ